MSYHDEPFMEHPTGEFPDAVTAMEDAIERLRALKTWDRWITFSGQGQGSRLDSYHIADVRLLEETIDVGAVEIDLAAILEAADVQEGEVQISIDPQGRLYVPGATAEQLN